MLKRSHPEQPSPGFTIGRVETFRTFACLCNVENKEQKRSTLAMAVALHIELKPRRRNRFFFILFLFSLFFRSAAIPAPNIIQSRGISFCSTVRMKRTNTRAPVSADAEQYFGLTGPYSQPPFVTTFIRCRWHPPASSLLNPIHFNPGFRICYVFLICL